MSAATPFLNEIMLRFVMKIVRYRLPRFTIDIFLEEVKDEDIGWRAALGTAILELCVFGAEMDEDVIQEVLSSEPFAAEFGKSHEATVALIQMVNSGHWDEIKAGGADNEHRSVEGTRYINGTKK
jgi:phenylpyruvate tautomerase PptA (4-oxalocrotonate tautomerase family)